ncbi:hypothetical protein M3J09_013723 [Ascochyta lentis]
MLAIETPQSPPLFSKKSLFRRFTRKERPLEISSPIIGEVPEPQPQSPRSPRKLQRRSNERQLERVPESAPTLPPLHTQPKTFITHIRVDSGTFSDLPISQQFTAQQFTAPPASPTRSHHSSRPSTSSTTTTSSRVTRTAHATSPFPHNTRIGAWDLFLPPSQVRALYTGHCPITPTTDQWFVFSEGPDVNGKLKVHFHRAWSGLKIAELFVVMDLKGEGAGKVVGVKWNGSEQTGRLGEEQAKRGVRGCCRSALGIELEGEEF